MYTYLELCQSILQWGGVGWGGGVILICDHTTFVVDYQNIASHRFNDSISQKVLGTNSFNSMIKLLFNWPNLKNIDVLIIKVS